MNAELPTPYCAASDIAAYAGVVPSAVSMWQKRHADFPRPVYVIAQGKVKVWSSDDVYRWLARHDKLGN